MKKIIYFLLLLTCSSQAQYITGGYQINVNQAPYQASLQLNDSHICGCSVLNNQWLITAAHCVKNQALSNLKIKTGYTNLLNASANSATHSLNQIIVHPSYNSSNNDNDIALIKISGNINFNNDTQPIGLANPADNLTNIGENTKISGWGWTVPGMSSGANQLMMVDVPIISNSNASSQLDVSYSGHPSLTNNMIATGSVSTNRLGACHGDSGGPLVATTSSGIVKQIGTVSWGVPTCVGGANSPSIYAKVENYIPWIYQYISPYNLYGSISLCTLPAQAFVGITQTPQAGSIINWSVDSNVLEISGTLPPSTTNASQILVKSKLDANSYGTGKVSVTINGVIKEHIL